MSAHELIKRYFLPQLVPATVAVLSGARGGGKTYLARCISEQFNGAIIWFIAISEQKLLVAESSFDSFDAGETIAANELWAVLLSRASGGGQPLMIVIDNAHLLDALASSVSTFYQLAEVGHNAFSLLLVGQAFHDKGNQLRHLCPVWLDIPVRGISGEGNNEEGTQKLLQRIASRSKNPLRMAGVVERIIKEARAEDKNEIEQVVADLLFSRRRGAMLSACYAVLACAIGWMSYGSWPNALPVPRAEHTAAVVKVPRALITDRPAGERRGMQGLISTWGYEVSPEMAWCSRIEAAELRCESGTAQMDDLLRRGLPWMARLKVGTQELYAVVVRVGDETIDLLLNQQIWTVRRVWFAKAWQGQYTSIIKTTPGGAEFVTDKSTPEQIIWLDVAISQVINVPASKTSGWNPLLTKKVKQFQSLQQLKTDGIAGKLTLVRLFQALGESPKLQLGEGAR